MPQAIQLMVRAYNAGKAQALCDDPKKQNEKRTASGFRVAALGLRQLQLALHGAGTRRRDERRDSADGRNWHLFETVQGACVCQCNEVPRADLQSSAATRLESRAERFAVPGRRCRRWARSQAQVYQCALCSFFR